MRLNVPPNWRLTWFLLGIALALLAMLVIELARGFVTAMVARSGLAGKMADDDLVCPPPVSACDHPARRLALPAFHAQLSRRRRSARRAWARRVLRNGATVGL